LGQLERGLPTTAADIEHPFSWFDAGSLHGYEAEWMNLCVKLLLPLDPARSPLFVPIADLFEIGLWFWHNSPFSPRSTNCF
jgi:hypothetical protein